MRDRVRFTVLGPVRAWRDTAEVPLGPPQQRAVLAALLLGEGAQVPVHQLVDAVWGANAPGSAVGSVRTYVHRLRRLLEARLIRSVGDGYLAEVDEDALDLAVFRKLVARAERARARGGTEEASAALHDALALWQGTALAGIRGAYAEAQRTRLTKLRLSALEARLAAGLELGAHAEAAAELADLVAAHPFDERFREMQMLALYRSGRQAAALATYGEARRLLAEELGVDPGPALRAMHERILRADDGLLPRAGEGPLARTARGPLARTDEGTPVRSAPEHEPTAGTEPEPLAGRAEALAP
ncbi:AfsR/SARP family transcriptional regulator, partial [Streptomyces sp. GC420]|uniref:AfsR/SARP family transcriptional regulator n=1 Tax=Streptomyces sp. GC420 TaxID=2697568 RepID=UPI0028BE07CA